MRELELLVVSYAKKYLRCCLCFLLHEGGCCTSPGAERRAAGQGRFSVSWTRTTVGPLSLMADSRPVHPLGPGMHQDLFLFHGSSRRGQVERVAGGPLGGNSRLCLVLCLVQYQPVQHLPEQTAKKPIQLRYQVPGTTIVYWCCRLDRKPIVVVPRHGCPAPPQSHGSREAIGVRPSEVREPIARTLPRTLTVIFRLDNFSFFLFDVVSSGFFVYHPTTKANYYWRKAGKRRLSDGFFSTVAEWIQARMALLCAKNPRSGHGLLPKDQEKSQNTRFFRILKGADTKPIAKCRTILFVYTSQRCLSSVDTQLDSGAKNSRIEVRPFVSCITGCLEVLSGGSFLDFLAVISILDWSFRINSLPRLRVKNRPPVLPLKVPNTG